jgi:hypothetical protein
LTMAVRTPTSASLCTKTCWPQSTSAHSSKTVERLEHHASASMQPPKGRGAPAATCPPCLPRTPAWRHRDESQRWQLVSACLEHCRLNLAGMRSAAAHAKEAASAGPALPPGVDVLVDILGEQAQRATTAGAAVGAALTAAASDRSELARAPLLLLLLLLLQGSGPSCALPWPR